jgi:hypothetical protein
VKNIPLILSKFLEDKSILKVGSYVTTDQRLIHEDWKVEMGLVRNLGSICKERNLISSARISLKNLAQNFLHRSLDKGDTSPRFSKWSGGKLSADQLKYAALNAYVSMQIYLLATKDAFTLLSICSNTADEEISPVSTSTSQQSVELFDDVSVKLDLFHALKRITETIPEKHPVKWCFAARLRDAVFKFNTEDRKRLDDYLKSLPEPCSFEMQVLEKFNWIRQRCRRYVPEAKTLERDFIEVIRHFDKD